jgi:uncharacterized membrane protein
VPEEADEHRLVLLWRSMTERLRSSLFGVPALWLLGAIVLSRATVWMDDNVAVDDLPLVFATTVDNARALLGAVASGTIAAASIVFSLTLLAFQLASSSYSSRVQRTFLRDPFQQNMIGIVLATFFYSLLVLREVRGPLDGSGSAEVPSLSTSVATALALAAVLALLASISHTGRSIRVSDVSARLAAETRATIERQLPAHGQEGRPMRPSVQAPGTAPSPLEVTKDGSSAGLGEGFTVTSLGNGWVQQIGIDALSTGLEGGSAVMLHVAVGTYVATGAPLASLRPVPGDVAAAERTIRGAIRLGPERTLQQDVAFGLTMLEDIALRALSPGVNDPNTARAIIPLLGDLLQDILGRELPPATATVDDVEVGISHPATYGDYLEAATGQIRRASVDLPEVRLTLVRTLTSAGDALVRSDRRSEEAIEALVESIARIEPDPDSTDPALSAATEILDATEWYRGT